MSFLQSISFLFCRTSQHDFYWKCQMQISLPHVTFLRIIVNKKVRNVTDHKSSYLACSIDTQSHIQRNNCWKGPKYEKLVINSTRFCLRRKILWNNFQRMLTFNPRVTWGSLHPKLLIVSPLLQRWRFGYCRLAGTTNELKTWMVVNFEVRLLPARRRTNELKSCIGR